MYLLGKSAMVAGNMGPLQLEQGSGAHYTIIIARNPLDSIGNH